MLPGGFALTPEEQAELQARPIGEPQWRGLTDAQIALRIEIGKKFQAYANSTDPTMAPRYRVIYDKCPMWGFYESAETADAWPPRRAYGVCIGEGGEERLHAATLMMAVNNKILDGIPVTALRRVDRWSPQTIQRMRCGMYRGIGIWEDPLGFVQLLREEHGE